MATSISTNILEYLSFPILHQNFFSKNYTKNCTITPGLKSRSFLRKKSIASFNAIHAIRISTKISYNPQIIKSLVYTLEKQAFDFDTRRSRRGNLDQGEGEGKKGHARSTGVVVLAPT